MFRKFSKRNRPILILVVLSIFFVYIFSNKILAYKTHNQQMLKETQNVFNEIHKKGKSPAILLIHGFGGSPVDVKPLADILEKSGYTFKAILLPGHGTSPKDLKNIKMNEWLNKSLLEFDKLRQNYEEVYVVGFSMGGAISLILATERHVSKLVLICPYFKVKERWYYFGKPETWAKRVSFILPYVKKPKIGQINNPEGLQKYTAYESLPTKTISELAKLGHIAAEKAKQVKSDILWIHSRGDNVADFKLSMDVFQLTQSKNKYFIEYNQSNHIILYDYDSEDTIKKIMAFIEGDYNE